LKSGIRVRLFVPRAYCSRCHRLHTELPSFVQPYKHYEASVIQNVIDKKSLDTCPAEDSTIHRWTAMFQLAAPYIEMMLLTIQQKLTKTSPLLYGQSLLFLLHQSKRRWLGFVTQLLISSGFSLPTQFACLPPQ
jgi:hypothetical protein